MESFLESFSLDMFWDILCIQEFCRARPAGLQIRAGHLVIVGGSATRKCPALIIHRRWIPMIKTITKHDGAAVAELHIPGNPSITLVSIHIDPKMRSAADFEDEIMRLESIAQTSRYLMIGTDLNTELCNKYENECVGTYVNKNEDTLRARRMLDFLQEYGLIALNTVRGQAWLHYITRIPPGSHHDHGPQIDFLLISKRFMQYATDCRVHKDTGYLFTDHMPVSCRIDLETICTRSKMRPKPIRWSCSDRDLYQLEITEAWDQIEEHDRTLETFVQVVNRLADKFTL